MKSFSNRIIYEGLTFDDVLLLPAASWVLPRDVDLTTRFSRNIILSAPIVSSAMDTVTDSSLAIAIAREGGIGVIHKNMSIEQQMEHVRKVKRSESGMIYDPIVISPDACVGDALKLMADNHIGGIPVVDEKHHLIGIITNRDLRFVENLATPIRDIMTKENLITIHDGADLGSATELLKIYKIEKLPVVDKNFKLIGLLTFKDITKIKDNPKASKDSKGRLRTAAAVGVKADTLEKIEKLLTVDIDAVVIDTAHGHSAGVLETVRKAKQAFPHLDIVAGNVATASGALALAEAGADAVKVGIGPGSICTTRVVTGIGVPQITAVMECARVARERGIAIIADGGIRLSGDITKALAVGANAVMLGSLFAGTDESPGQVIRVNGKDYKSYRGMGSLGAMDSGSADRYFQSENKKYVPEGIEGTVLYKGAMKDVVYQLMGGLRSGMGYVGAANLTELYEKSKLIKITQASLIENHPHDIEMIKAAPNYTP